MVDAKNGMRQYQERNCFSGSEAKIPRTNVATSAPAGPPATEREAPTLGLIRGMLHRHQRRTTPFAASD